MKISIVTVCYNAESTIRDTIESVLNQSYDNYEHLIIDGKSKDNTLKIIEEYKKKYKGKLKVISEKDSGLYDAMNKGIKNATGDIIGFLNSDDKYADNKTLEKISKKLKGNQYMGCYSDLEFRDNESMQKIIRVWKSKKGNYKFGWHPPHPTLYLKKEAYKIIGQFNLKYRICADYDFMLRMMKKEIKLAYISQTLIHMRSGGLSTNGISGYIRNFKESYKVLQENEVKFSFIVNCIRTMKTILQMLKSKIKYIK